MNADPGEAMRESRDHYSKGEARGRTGLERFQAKWNPVRRRKRVK
jgi:hypothetical protein